MNSLRYIYQLLLILCVFVAGATNVFAIEDSQVQKTPEIKSQQPLKVNEDDMKQYIKDIEISGSNVIKPEYIL